MVFLEYKFHNLADKFDKEPSAEKIRNKFDNYFFNWDIYGWGTAMQIQRTLGRMLRNSY